MTLPTQVQWTGLGAAVAALVVLATLTGLAGSGAAAGAGAYTVAATGASGSNAAAPTPPRYSVKDSPGYYSSVDPESMSVVIGRRVNAPLVSKPFKGGARSLDDLGRAVCRALHHAAADSLLGLCITDDEFRDILWREFPQSRPAVGLTWQDAWTVLYARLRSGSLQAKEQYQGHVYEFLRFERTDTTALYKNFKLHNGLVMVVRDDTGQIQKWNWLRSAAERKGRFKIYSTTD